MKASAAAPSALKSTGYDPQICAPSTTSGMSYERGRKAGREIVLHRPVHGSSERGRLLGPVR